MHKRLTGALGALVALAAFGAVVAGGAGAAASTNVPCPASGVQATGLVTAIANANAAGGGSINLAAGCTYSLLHPDNVRPRTGANGLPAITTNINVNGHESTISGNSTNFRIFEVDAGGNLSLNGVTVTGGASPTLGGGILNREGTVRLNRSVVTGNSVTGSEVGGGGIASGTFRTGPIGTLTLNNSSVTDNVSGNGGGGILNHAGTLTINNSEVNDNTAQGGGGGIASGRGGETGNSVLELNNSQVNGNTSNGGVFAGAGGIANGGSMTINNTQVNGNMAPDAPGGGILNHGLAVINNTDVNGNMALGDTGGGGGIANADDGAPDSGVLDLNNVRVMHNEADGGGGGILNGLAIVGVPPGAITTNNIKVILNSPDNCEPLGTIAGCTG